MFIRRTQTRSARSGEVYFTFRLVRSERIGSKVRQRTLLNLGRHFEVAQSAWPVLCRRIDEVLNGQLPLNPDCPPALEAHAQRIAAQLLARERTGTPVAAHRPDIQRVDVDSLELIRPRSVGVEHVGLWAMDQLGLRPLLEEPGDRSHRCAPPHIGSIIARMARPGSERATRRWLGERSALGELLEVDFQTMGPMQLYRASDALMAHREAIESHLFDQALGLFDLHPTVTLYDLTNTFFEGEAARQPKAKRGHSKDKRTDCPLLTLALVTRRQRLRAAGRGVREHHSAVERSGGRGGVRSRGAAGATSASSVPVCRSSARCVRSAPAAEYVPSRLLASSSGVSSGIGARRVTVASPPTVPATTPAT